MLWSGCGDCEAVEFVTEVTELIPGFFAQKQGHSFSSIISTVPFGASAQPAGDVSTSCK